MTAERLCSEQPGITMDAATALLLLVLLLVVLLALGPRRPAGFPPGPRSWSWLGTLPALLLIARLGQTAAFERLARRHGPVFGLLLPGGVPLVVIREFSVMKQAFGEPAFSGRPDIFTFIYRAFMKKQGLVFAEGTLWTEHRRFALSHLRQLGFGKRSMEQHMTDEYRGLSRVLRAAAGRELPLRGLFDASIINVIWQMIAGRRYELGDRRLTRLQATIAEMVEVAGVEVPVNICPPLRHLLPRWSGFQRAADHRQKVATMFTELVREHAATLQLGEPSRDFVDDFLLAAARPGAPERGYTIENLSVIGMDLFSAGSDTTAHVLGWTLLELARHPAVQRRLRRQLDAAVGRRRLPRLSDQRRLPLCRAVLEEVLRLHTVVPQALPHCTSFGAALLGPYTVPRGAFVFSDLRAVHMDERHWGDPAAFRPDRFLGEGGEFRADERVVAFGVGRRHCPAETVARQELFLFASGLLHQFTVEPGSAPPPPAGSRKEGFVHMPPPVGVVLRWRKDAHQTEGELAEQPENEPTCQTEKGELADFATKHQNRLAEQDTAIEDQTRG